MINGGDGIPPIFSGLTKEPDKARGTIPQFGVLFAAAECRAGPNGNCITEKIAQRLNLQYGDARNQIKALTELGLIDVFDQKGKTFLYGLTSDGISMTTNMFGNGAQPSIAPQSVVPKVEVNGHSRLEESPEMFASEASVEKASEVCVVFIGLQDLASLIQQAVTQSRGHA